MRPVPSPPSLSWRHAPRPLLSQTRAPLLGAALLLVLLFGCRERRRPLTRSADGGPVVEVAVAPKRPAGPSPFAGAVSEEHEPDDDREHAQPLETGKGVRGSVAPPTQEGAGKGDDDWYSLLVQAPTSAEGAPGEPPGAQELRVQLSSATDLQLDIMDGEGRRLVNLDEQKGGESELLGGFSVASGQTLYLRVRPSGRRQPRRPATPPGQVVVVADPSYTLSVQQQPAPRGSEAEPNDAAAQATPLRESDTLLSGVLHSRKDEDWFVLDLSQARGAASGILRIEAQTPGVTPALRVEAAPPPSPAPALGKAPPAARALLADIKAGSASTTGREELRARNLGLPAGTGLLYLGLRSQAWKPAAMERRYQLRVTLEPALEDAEQEPNDAPAQATVLLLSRRGGGGASEGGLNGFLWPGDVDHYRIPVEEPSQVTLQLLLPEGCAATLAEVSGSGLPGAPGSKPETKSEPKGDGRAQSLTLSVSAVAQVKVAAQGAAGCFEAPYHLQARVEPDPNAAKPPGGAPAGRPGAP